MPCRTNQLIRNLMIVSLNSGTWTALFALLVIIMVSISSCSKFACTVACPRNTSQRSITNTSVQELVRPEDLWYSVFNYPICALYCNSLLGNLNLRNMNKNLDHVHDLGGNILPLSNVTFTRVNVERSVVDDNKAVSGCFSTCLEM
jgi:hypothetical protein